MDGAEQVDLGVGVGHFPQRRLGGGRGLRRLGGAAPREQRDGEESGGAAEELEHTRIPFTFARLCREPRLNVHLPLVARISQSRGFFRHHRGSFLALTFQDLILTLHHYWSAQGCVLLQPYDLEMGAGTFHPATVLRALGPDPWKCAYVQPCRRPTDGRYGENPNRLGHYYQYQVMLKPSPPDLQELYLGSLAEIGIDPLKHDIRFVEDDWESPTLGAWGLGWEVWCDGMEVTQFTYFQQVGGFDCKPVAGELTYGLERLAMYIQGVDNVFDLKFNDAGVTYGDVFLAQ